MNQLLLEPAKGVALVLDRPQSAQGAIPARWKAEAGGCTWDVDEAVAGLVRAGPRCPTPFRGLTWSSSPIAGCSASPDQGDSTAEDSWKTPSDLAGPGTARAWARLELSGPIGRLLDHWRYTIDRGSCGASPVVGFGSGAEGMPSRSVRPSRSRTSRPTESAFGPDRLVPVPAPPLRPTQGSARSLLGFVLSLASTAASLVPPYLTIPLVDEVLHPRRERPIGELLAGLALSWGTGRCGGPGLGPRLGQDLRHRLGGRTDQRRLAECRRTGTSTASRSSSSAASGPAT